MMGRMTRGAKKNPTSTTQQDKETIWLPRAETKSQYLRLRFLIITTESG